jgi:hypothetical protein
MIGGKRQHHGLRIAVAGERRAGGERGTGIAAHRFDQDRDVDADFFSLPPREKAVIATGDHDRAGEQGVVGHSQQRVLVGGALANQRQELLRQGVA